MDGPPGNRRCFSREAPESPRQPLSAEPLRPGQPENRIENILYATFDHPLLKLVGVEEVLQCGLSTKRGWRPHYLFLDEIQAVKDWQVWLEAQVDFDKRQHRSYRFGPPSPF